MPERRELSIDDLNVLLRLDPDTGRLFWRHRDPRWFRDGTQSAEMAANSWNSRFAEKEALTASQGERGYKHGQILGRQYQAHRIVFALHNGRWPVGYLDHRDRDKGNNAPNNLREATRRQNQANVSGRGKHSEYRGVWWIKRRQRWWAGGTDSSGKRRFLGSHVDEQSAAHAYDKFAHEQYGEFAKLNFPDQSGGVA